MRADWQALRAKLVWSSSTLAFQKDFEAICNCAGPLRRYRDPAALLDRLHGPGDDHEARNKILRALVVEAQSGGTTSRAAVTLLLLALWPGLDHVRHRIARAFPECVADLASEIVTRASERVLTMNLGEVRKIAAGVTRSVQRDITADLVAQAERANETEEYSENDGAISDELPSRLGLPAGLDAKTGAAMIGDLLRAMIGDDAELVLAIAVAGERQHEAAGRLGLTPDSARKRYQRALTRLRQHLSELNCSPLSQNRCGNGFSQSSTGWSGAARTGRPRIEPARRQ